MCVCVEAAGSCGARDIDIKSLEEGEAKWRSYSNTVSNVLDTRGLGGGREGGRNRIRKHQRTME